MKLHSSLWLRPGETRPRQGRGGVGELQALNDKWFKSGSWIKELP